ncbi:Phospholipase A1-II 1 [Rhynchospora pubera]|uniref:Phospholipase A1 n=1 Tax=Rhynchospora pubera TaxID=906938 RepID=A0AAV8F3G9_9POAL|nr:Phospholipase A1-II 1 [Rhynchospora pubera]
MSARFFGDIAKRWKEIHGNSNWKNMLDPLDIDLRRSIINYGEMAQATYDGFNRETRSPNLGAPRYKRSELLKKVRVSVPSSYKVTKYLYATSSINVPDAFIVNNTSSKAWSKVSNWIGYVAVATEVGKALLGRRDIVVAWRGTLEVSDWVKDMDITLVSASPLLGRQTISNKEPLVHRGFLSIYTSEDPSSRFNKKSARDQVLTEIGRLIDEYSGEETSITITGHSLGAALATLNAIDIISNHLNRSNHSPSDTCPVTGIIFASPRVGDVNFSNLFSQMPDLRLLRIRNVLDIVPKCPPPVVYTDVGVELTIDASKSPYLKNQGNPVIWHNLEHYLHGVAGVQKEGFELAVDRDIALVNKRCDSLKDKFPVPVSWWISQNRDMVQGADGHWILDDYYEDDNDM